MLRYEEWAPAAPELHGIVTAFWRVEGDPSDVPSSSILPDCNVELVVNRGEPVRLAGSAFTGEQPPRVVVGLLSHAVAMDYRGRVDTLGIRLHPAAGPALLDARAAELVDTLLPLDAVSPALDRELDQLIVPAWKVEQERDRGELERVLLRQLSSSREPDHVIASVVDRLTASPETPTVAEIARELRLSSRQVQRRFLAAVGMAPKQFVRTHRFARLWQMASMSRPETWGTLAAEHGYADQAHMIREFRRFGVEPPAQFFSADWYDATELSRVRSVQESARK